MTADAYPLVWPDGWPRTPDWKRPSGRQNFMRGSSGEKYAWTFAEARDELLKTLRGWKASQIVLSSNFPVARDGLMVEGRRRPPDQSVAIYFQRGGQSYVMAFDGWADVESNLRSLALAIDAMRQLERHGGPALAGRAFQGFVALPAPKPPHEILGVSRDASEPEVRAAWRRQLAEHHPDRGGSESRAAELNAARDAMLKRLAS